MTRILVVEDNPDQLEIRTLLLENAGYEVRGARSPEEAITMLEPPPAAAIVDLSIPNPAQGRSLVRELNSRIPETPIAVLTGWGDEIRKYPEQQYVTAVLEKPCPTRKLLETLTRLIACLILIVLPAAAREFQFTSSERGETIATLQLRSPDSDFSSTNRTAAVARLRVDDGPVQHIIVYGERKERYSVFLGPLSPGKHTLTVERDEQFSAPGSKLEIGGVKFREDNSEVVLHAPILFAREDTIGKFSDVPLFMYAEILPLTYTVIFSNEDGGHSTSGLMSRWGRTTDIEYIYRVEAKGTFIQAKGHQDIRYEGEFIGKHPLLVPVTLNNMVAPGKSIMRFQMLPEEVVLDNHSREVVMDQHPWTYAIASKEMIREGRINEIRDPRNYLYIEAKIRNQNSRVAFKTKLVTESHWRTSHRGDIKMAIERNGWVRATIELPPNTSSKQIAEFGYDCLREKEGVEPVCTAESIKAFFLTPDYVPGRPIRLPNQ